MKFLVTLLFVSAAICKAKESHDPTADILKGLQDSGVLDGVKEQLEEMLHSGDLDSIKEEILKKEKDLKSKIEKQVAAERKVDEEMLAFAQSYAAEKDLKISKDVLKALSQIPGKEEKTMHFVKLSSVLELVDKALNSGRIKEGAIKNAKFKNLDEVKKMVNENDSKKQEKAKKSEDVKPKKKESILKEPHESKSQMAMTIRTFASMAGQNPEVLTNAVIGALGTYKLVSEDTLETMRGYSKGIAGAEGFATGVEYLGESVAGLAESELGSKLFEILPLLASEDTRDQAFEKLKEETERLWGRFFNSINNSDMKEKFLGQCAETMNSGYKYLFKDQMKMMVANAFLISQGLPPIVPKNIFGSVTDLADKSLKLFTTYKIDLQPLKAPAQEFIKKLETEYIQIDEFDKLNSKEQSELIARFLDDNVVTAAQDLFQAHDFVYVSGNRQCAESVICSVNEHARTSSDIKKQVLKGMSMVLGWLWSFDGQTVDEWKLYEAVQNGADADKKCGLLYKTSDCKVFDWQKDLMSLNFDHQEL